LAPGAERRRDITDAEDLLNPLRSSSIEPARAARRRAAVICGAALAASAASPLCAQERPEVAYYVYVAAESEDEVSVVRFGPAGTDVVETLPVGLFPAETDGPHGIAVDPAESNWYVSIAHGMPYGQIHRYSLDTNERTGRVEVGLFPATMAVSPAGLLFVVNFNLHGDMVPSSVSVVETESMVEIHEITTCAMPHGSRLSPDGRRHYSVCMMGDQLVEIDALELVVTRRMHLTPGLEREIPPDRTEAAGMRHGAGAADAARCGPTWVQPSPDGRMAYVACNGNRQVLEIDLGDWTVTRRFATGAGPYNLDVSPDGASLVVTYKGDGAVGVFDLATGEERAAVASTRRIPHGVVVSPDSRYAFVSIEGVGAEPGTVDVIDLASGVKVGSADVGRQAGGIGFWKMEAGG
jgi:DNA-binding beta-propeller fold protein YncE